MARHGENIRKRKDGRWEGRYKEYSIESGVHRYRSVYGRSYKEAKEKLAVQKIFQRDCLGKAPETLQDGLPTQNLDFQDIAEEWLESVRADKKPSTYQKYSIIYHRYLKGVFKDAALPAITSQSVRDGFSDSISDSVLKSVYCVLNQILRYASVRYSMMLPEIQKPAASMKNKPATALSKAELDKLFAVLLEGTDIYKTAVLTCLHTGLRLGEACALKWSDIDFTDKVIKVSRTVQRLYEDGHDTKTILMETEPKSGFSKREVPIAADVMEMLFKLWNEREYIFGGDRPLDPRTLQYQFKKILSKAGLSDKNFHILRHTFATNCIEGKMDVKSLSEILGHANVQITLNRYVHPSMESKRKHMEGLYGFCGQNYGQTG